jgi:hypothetical protein
MSCQTTKPSGSMDLVMCDTTIVRFPMDAPIGYFWLLIKYLKICALIFWVGVLFYFFSYALPNK